MLLNCQQLRTQFATSASNSFLCFNSKVRTPLQSCNPFATSPSNSFLCSNFEVRKALQSCNSFAFDSAACNLSHTAKVVVSSSAHLNSLANPFRDNFNLSRSFTVNFCAFLMQREGPCIQAPSSYQVVLRCQTSPKFCTFQLLLPKLLILLLQGSCLGRAL